MSFQLPPLPEFADGAILGASDLNRIGQAQSYINQVLNRASVPFRYMAQDETRYCVHQFRYLHWVTTSASGAALKLNGSTVATASSTSGTVDLNSLGLAVGDVYTLKWTGATTTCKRLFEFPTSSGSLSLPASTPTFTTGANDSQLSAVVDNTKYLIDNVQNAAYTPFISMTLHPVPSQTLTYGMKHAHRYLFFEGQGWYSGTQGTDDFHIDWKINGTTFRTFNSDGDNDDGGAYFYFNWWYDLQGTNHTDNSYTITGLGDAGTWSVANGSTLGLSLGDWIELKVDVTEAHLNTRFRVELIGEYSAKSLW